MSGTRTSPVPTPPTSAPAGGRGRGARYAYAASLREKPRPSRYWTSRRWIEEHRAKPEVAVREGPVIVR